MLEAYRTPDRLRARIAFHERYKGGGEDFHRRLFSLVTQRVEPAAGARILEVGSGTGRLWSMNAERVPPGWRITLTDASEGMVNAAREAAADAGLAATVLRADVQQLPFDATAFDLAFANHMLYHVPDLPRGLAELRRVLAPGGWLVAATNGAEHLAAIRDLALPLADVVTLYGVEPLSFTLENGAELLAAGFGEVELIRLDDEVLVDDAEVLLAYLRSMIYLPDDPGAEVASRLAEFEESVRERLAGGPLPVRRSTGFFLACRS